MGIFPHAKGQLTPLSLVWSCQEMHRTGILISCRNDISGQYDINRTPGLLPGSYLTLTTEIQKDHRANVCCLFVCLCLTTHQP